MKVTSSHKEETLFLLNRRNIAKHPLPGFEFFTLCVSSEHAACRFVARLGKINVAMRMTAGFHVYPKATQLGKLRQTYLTLFQKGLARIYPQFIESKNDLGWKGT